MIHRRLSTREAAARLGVKPATLYSYASRGLLHPERTAQGSFYDTEEVLRLSRTARRPGQGLGRARRADGPRPEDPVFMTELTLIDGGRLYYRGMDAVELSRRRRFEEVATWLWTGEWPAADEAWELPERLAVSLRHLDAALPVDLAPVERFVPALVTAALGDELRHDLSPAGVSVTGRTLLAALAASLPLSAPAGAPPARRLSQRVWSGLTRRSPTWAGIGALEAALVLAADHELAPSTLAARVAAGFRADPYAVVTTALGPAGGSSPSGSTGAPSEVERLLAEAARVGPERAIGERLRRLGAVPHGFGMPLYPAGDPRGAELLRRLEGVGPRKRVELVHRVVAVATERGFAPPNFDLALGALSYCAGMDVGAAQAVFTLGKAAGWVAHALEEYGAPTRFRARAHYVGAPPEESAP
jgi:citrate synthase